MQVRLTPELEERIADKVASGLYSDASEVVREGLRLLFGADDIGARPRFWPSSQPWGIDGRI